MSTEISLYLAMTSAEISGCDSLPPGLAYMACHFAAYGSGLSDIPDSLPPSSVLILNDRVPICGHDPKQISFQLSQAIEKLQCSCLLLDFQRPGIPETATVCKHLTEALRIPIGISAPYADSADCAVFLPPCPLDQPLEDYLALWKPRPIWLELAADIRTITVDEHGSRYTNVAFVPSGAPQHKDTALSCHYQLNIENTSVTFTLWRTASDTQQLIERAAELGVSKCFGLWQEHNST